MSAVELPGAAATEAISTSVDKRDGVPASPEPKRKSDAQVYKRHAKIPMMSEIDKLVTINFDSGSYQIPATLLAHHSGYFRTALNSSFAESHSLEFSLVEHAKKDTMSAFVQWIYGRYYLEGHALMDKITNLSKDTVVWRPSLRYQMWLLADYLHIPDLQNDVMCTLHNKRAFYVNKEVFKPLQNLMGGKLAVGSQLFRFHCMIEAARIVDGQHISDTESYLTSLDPDMVLSIATFLAKQKSPIIDLWDLTSFMVDVEPESSSD